MIQLRIIILLMTTTHHQEVKILKTNKNGHPRLFPLNSPNNRTSQFQQIYEKFKKETQQAAKIRNNIEKTKKVNDNNCAPQIRQNTINVKITDFKDEWGMKKETLDEREEKKVRPLSSNKFDCPPKKTDRKKSNRFIQYLFEQVKQSEFKETPSKKSTDNQTSSEIAKVREENRQFAQNIRKEKHRAVQLERQIAEESKRHQLQKHLYQHTIDKLRKKISEEIEDTTLGQIQELHESFLSNNQEDEIDSLSIESN